MSNLKKVVIVTLVIATLGGAASLLKNYRSNIGS